MFRFVRNYRDPFASLNRYQIAANLLECFKCVYLNQAISNTIVFRPKRVASCLPCQDVKLRAEIIKRLESSIEGSGS